MSAIIYEEKSFSYEFYPLSYEIDLLETQIYIRISIISKLWYDADN